MIEIEACPEYNAAISHFILIPTLFCLVTELQLQGFFVKDFNAFRICS